MTTSILYVLTNTKLYCFRPPTLLPFLAFFGLFRVGELTFTTRDMSERPIFISDLILHKQCATIKLRKSKSNQNGQVQIVKLEAVDTRVCPIYLLKKYLSMRSQGSRYLFCHADGLPMTHYQFGAVLSKTLKKLNKSNSFFRTHSFRIGAASWLASKGVDNQTIKKLGRWSSNAFTKYIRL